THRIRAQNEQSPVQEIPSIFTRDRKLRFRNHLAEGLARECRFRRARRLGQRWEVLTRKGLHARVEFVGGNLHAVLVFLDTDVRLGECLHDLVEFLCRQRQRTTFRDRRITPAAQRDLEVGREHTHFVTLRFDQHVRENWNRVLAFYDALKKLQFSQKLVLSDHEFHRLTVTSERSGVSAVNGACSRYLLPEQENLKRQRIIPKRRCCAKQEIDKLVLQYQSVSVLKTLRIRRSPYVRFLCEINPLNLIHSGGEFHLWIPARLLKRFQ